MGLKLWGGRFSAETNRLVNKFQASIAFDQRLYRHDIQGSIAHARMLASCGIISAEESKQIIEGLKQVQLDIESGRSALSEEQEDIHLNIEYLLIQKIGKVGEKLHTARSRNDQVALDLRLYLREAIINLVTQLDGLVGEFLGLAEQHRATIMPGYTHLQKAQPITLGHYLSAYASMLIRDMERLRDTFARVNQCPLGAGALAGTTLPIDRQMVARELGFSGLAVNTLDAVSDRDFVIEFLSDVSMLMMHLSRLSEELILWASEEFAFIEIDDAFATGSSMMPQKKNPDVAELIRGKTGRVYGHLMGLLTTMKGLPLAYNKDLQEDKESLFDAGDTVSNCVAVLAAMLRHIRFNQQRMYEEANQGFACATDVAEYLVARGVPFREAHAIVGKLVRYALETHKQLPQLTQGEWQQFSPHFGEDIYQVIQVEEAVNRRRLSGGPAPEATMAEADRLRLRLGELRKWKEEKAQQAGLS